LLKTDLFDEAVGRGLYPELARHGAEVYGIDVSAVAVSAATRRYDQLEGRVGDVLAIPFDDECFDVVVSNSTLDHFGSHAQLRLGVAELRRVMVRPGRLIITLDNRLNPVVALRTSRLSEKVGRVMGAPYFLGVTHGPRGLARVLRQSGFEVLEMMAVMHCPPRLAASLAARRSSAGVLDEQSYLRRVLRFESIARWPISPLSGHFICALARVR